MEVVINKDYIRAYLSGMKTALKLITKENGMVPNEYTELSYMVHLIENYLQGRFTLTEANNSFNKKAFYIALEQADEILTLKNGE